MPEREKRPGSAHRAVVTGYGRQRIARILFWLSSGHNDKHGLGQMSMNGEVAANYVK